MKTIITGCMIILLSSALMVACVRANEDNMEEYYAKQRENMVREQIQARGITDTLVLSAMRTVPRHLFVPPEHRARAYGDYPLPIGWNQTISQPYIVAYMTEALHLVGIEKVLEIGTGSGYQAAVLAEIVDSVYTIEIVEPLAERTIQRLRDMHYTDIHCKIGDGYQGWPEHAPFDAIIVTAAPGHIPQPLVDQLAMDGRMIIPVGEDQQELILIERTQRGITQRSVLPVRFVPMTGAAQDRN